MQGYRNEDYKRQKFFDAGIVPKGRYFRLFIINAWSGNMGRPWKEVEFQSKLYYRSPVFGRQIQLGLTGSIEKRVRTVIYNRDTGSELLS